MYKFCNSVWFLQKKSANDDFIIEVSSPPPRSVSAYSHLHNEIFVYRYNVPLLSQQATKEVDVDSNHSSDAAMNNVSSLLKGEIVAL